jgi:hypothetical protein
MLIYRALVRRKFLIHNIVLWKLTWLNWLHYFLAHVLLDLLSFNFNFKNLFYILLRLITLSLFNSSFTSLDGWIAECGAY